ncbi:MAG: aminotransferase class III-fold pyridoxal phosphate-dependent enzyme [Chloroflexi bacterium]|nr:aminotransferase class III-fold pyridoxal phosphate-dependent enzyme [Chloroflexota bacterium]
MAISVPSGTTIDEAFRRKFARSAALYERARASIAGGITHDSRNFAPFPVYVERAQGSRKWDADGNELVDHWMGHGALILGHGHPAIQAALSEQVTLGTHYGASHEVEVSWAEEICRLVPSAEWVRFTMSGTESTMLAIRDARAFTGREKVIRFAGHFHGWHDYAMAGYQPPFDTPTSIGVPSDVAASMLIAYPNRIESVRALMDQCPDQVAAVILEPGGGSNGIIPTDIQFLRDLRDLTRERGVVLIFDEVITGFRYAPGGAQERYEVTPDITTLAKIVAGGLPGGAVAGRKDILDVQTFKGDLQKDRFARVLQQGTFNANPLSAVAGLTCLRIIAEGWPTEQAERSCEQLRHSLREVLQRRNVQGTVVGEASVFQILLGDELDEALAESDANRLMAGRGAVNTLRKAMLVNGVDLMRSGGFTSIAHGDQEIEHTINAFEASLEMLQREGLA